MADVIVESRNNASMDDFPLWIQPGTEVGAPTIQYTARQFRNLIDMTFTTPGVADKSAFAVTTGSNTATVDVSAGRAVVGPGGLNGKYLVSSTGTVNLTVPASTGATENFHRVVLEVMDKADAPLSDAPSAYGWRIRIIGWTGVAGQAPPTPTGALTLAILRRTGSGATAVDDRRTVARDTSGVPTGAIMMWSGLLSTIPVEWTVCNGVAVNGISVPDMRGRFPVGASQDAAATPTGTTYSILAAGGEEKHVLSVAEMPSHTHATGAAGAHYHAFNSIDGVSGSPTSAANQTGYVVPASSGSATYRTDAGIVAAGSHTHSVGATGSSQGHENRPPFRALYFIMKVY